MKTITFTNDQVFAVRDGLRQRIKESESLLADCIELNLPDHMLMFCRDRLDVARQALALVEG
jgi:hypothetical protein